MVTRNGNDYTELIKSVEKEFGAGAIRHAASPEHSAGLAVKAIPTGSINLDRATGIGGVPLGRITEIYGAESSGKSTLAIHLMAEAQKIGYDAAYIDAEHAMDAAYATRCGLDMDNLLISQPDSAEQALNVVAKLAEDGRVGLIIVDSVHAMVPEEEVNNNIGENTVALLPRIMSSSLRKLNPVIGNNNVALVFTNQLRDTIGNYGPKETTTGGRALKFYASLRVELRRGEAIKERNEIIGTVAKVRIQKNKCARPFRNTEFEIYFDEGISIEGEVLETAVEAGIISKRGAYYYYGEERIAQGKENAQKALKNDSAQLADILYRIRNG